MVVVPTLMWVKALDMILDKLRVCGVDFSKVAAISGCAQVKIIFQILKDLNKSLIRFFSTKLVYYYYN